MWFNDDDPEKVQTNWKNSEITKVFAEQYLKSFAKDSSDGECECEIESKEEEQEKNSGKESDEVQELVVILEPVALAKKEIDEVIEKLAALAEESMEYGNEKAIYLIERTIDEVRDIRNNLGA